MKKTVGGTAALAYTLKVARQMGISPSLQALYAKNTCKSCDLDKLDGRLTTPLYKQADGQVIIINPVTEKGLVNFTLPSDWRSMLGGGSEVLQPMLLILKIPVGIASLNNQGLIKPHLKK